MSRSFLTPALVAVLVLLSTTAFAQTTSPIPAGTTVGGPTFNRGAGTACAQVAAGGSGSAVAYRAVPFTVTAAGTYTITTQYPASFDGYINLYQGTFNPAASCTNRVAFSDDFGGTTGSQIANQALTAGNYVLVVTGFNNTSAGTYTGTVVGPGVVSFPVTSTIPAGTTVGGPTFNRGAGTACTQVAAGAGGSAVAYRAVPFTVTAAGNYTLTTQYPAGFDGYINLYQGTFNPAASCTNRIAFDDDFAVGGNPALQGSQIADQALTAGSYVLVVTGFGNTDAGTHTGTIVGPGAASFGVAGEGTAANSRSRLSAAPNPFQGTSTVRFTTAVAQDVTVAVYDMTGRQVATLFTGAVAADQEVAASLDGAQLSSGVYVIRATGSELNLTQRVTVVR